MPLGPEQALNEVGALSKRIYDTGVIDQEQRLTVTYDELDEKNWDLRGDGWFGDAHFKRSSSYKFARSTEPIPQETFEVSKQFFIQTAEMFGDVTFTKDFLTRLIGGKASFEDYTYKIEDLLRTQKKNLNQACYIGPTMQRALITAVVNPTTITVDNTQYLHIGMFIDVFLAAVQHSNNQEIATIVGLNVTVPSTVGMAVGDAIFLHEEKDLVGTGKGFNSLPFQCDDATDFTSTFENIDRNTFNGWKGNRIDVGGGVLTNDLLQTGENTLKEVGGNDYMSEEYVNFVHTNSIRRYIAIILPQKRYVDASKYDAGMEKPNMLEWNSRPIVRDTDCGKNDWIMYNKANGGKKEISALAIESMLGGASMKWKNGFMQGITLTYFSGNIGTNRCVSHLIFRNLKAL